MKLLVFLGCLISLGNADTPHGIMSVGHMQFLGSGYKGDVYTVHHHIGGYEKWVVTNRENNFITIQSFVHLWCLAADKNGTVYLTKDATAQAARWTIMKHRKANDFYFHHLLTGRWLASAPRHHARGEVFTSAVRGKREAWIAVIPTKDMLPNKGWQHRKTNPEDEEDEKEVFVDLDFAGDQDEQELPESDLNQNSWELAEQARDEELGRRKKIAELATMKKEAEANKNAWKKQLGTNRNL